jgi:RNA polymerase sigma-70 factor (ECF subfamily)
MSSHQSKSAQAKLSDEVLLGRIAGGDRQSIELLFRRHHARLFRFLARLVENEAVAEELVGDVFIEVWRHAGAFAGRARASTWILAIARHKALSALRRRTTDGLDEEAAGQIEDPADNPEVALAKAHRPRCRRAAVGGPPPGRRSRLLPRANDR